MYYYLGFIGLIKLTYDYFKTNMYLFNEYNNKLYFGKLKKIKFKNKNNIVKFIQNELDKKYILTTKNIGCDNIIHKNKIDPELVEEYHYKIGGIYTDYDDKELFNKISYINSYLSKIYLITNNPNIEHDILLDKPINEFEINIDNDNKSFIKKQYDFIMESKRIDINVSHNHPVNKFVHFWSSIIMIFYTYPYIIYEDYFNMVLSFFTAHIIRQSGHFFYERQDLDLEKLKFGHKNASKKETIFTLALFNSLIYYDENIISYSDYLFLNIILCVFPHYLEITHKHGIIKGINWIIKIITDPFTDLIDFYKYFVINPKHFLDIKEI